jgi:hypothetical protein
MSSSLTIVYSPLTALAAATPTDAATSATITTPTSSSKRNDDDTSYGSSSHTTGGGLGSSDDSYNDSSISGNNSYTGGGRGYGTTRLIDRVRMIRTVSMPQPSPLATFLYAISIVLVYLLTDVSFYK